MPIEAEISAKALKGHGFSAAIRTGGVMKIRSKVMSGWGRGVVGGMALGLALATAGAAQDQPAATQTAASGEQLTAAKAEGPPEGGMGEGIKVHGHWTIEVREPDGTLVSHGEFENALAPDSGIGSGAQFLSSVLARAVSVGSWSVGVYTHERCGVELFYCYLSELYGPQPGPGFGALAVSAPTSGTDAHKFVLIGNVVPAGDVTVYAVNTSPIMCASTVAPASGCNTSGTSTNFTFYSPGGPGGTIATASAGQIISIKIVISFS
jgi:hypothetical protein